ncbi:MAG: metallophosphoesterase [Thermoplasmatota archaeon]
MIEPYMEKKIQNVFQRSPVFKLGERDRMVVVSDLHMGDGSVNDDFKRTSRLFSDVFSGYYLDNGFDLLLNGDVEELHKFVLHGIRKRWASIYELFQRFQDELSLMKIIGNHDMDIWSKRSEDIINEHYRSARMKFRDAELFFLHGHQASNYLERLHNTQRVMLRTVGNSFKLKNFTLDLGKKGVTRKEERLSSYSLRKGIMTFMGHTHRPLFGSDSRTPLLYNSGAAIGKKGITTIEIDRGRLNLVHWWDKKVVKRYLNPDRFDPERLGRRDVYRVVLKSRKLQDIFDTWSLPSRERMLTMHV